jgi:taurine dioxygenase
MRPAPWRGVLPGQAELSGEAQRFCRQFGEIETPPKLTGIGAARRADLEWTQPVGAGTDIWHTDGSYLESPRWARSSSTHILPETGGDTCFASMSAAYEALSPPMQRMLEGLTATH